MDNPQATPASLGYRMPAEWEPQAAVWLSWPAPDSGCWPGTVSRVEHTFAQIAAAISRFEPVHINAPASRHQHIHHQLKLAGADHAHTTLFDHPNNDVWCRDHGPLFVKHATSGTLAATSWGFNGWGEKFTPFDLDDAIPPLIARSLDIPCFDADMVLEGGSIELNSLGQLLTTEAVLLNPNRNPHLSRQDIESRLKDFLGITAVFWLGAGIEGDDTDGHIDDLARFVDDHTILISREPDPASPNHRPLKDNLDRLQDFRLPDGTRPTIVELDLPQACHAPGWRLPILPASYVNFLIINGAVLAPTFGQPARDEPALALLADLFPTRQIIPIHALDLVKEGGAIHCISQQQPA